MTKPSITKDAMRVLSVLADSSEALTANEIGVILYGKNPSPQSRAATVAGNAWELTWRGLVERTLKRRELYIYNITDAGRALLASSKETS